jgi:hypothetical protein
MTSYSRTQTYTPLGPGPAVARFRARTGRRVSAPMTASGGPGPAVARVRERARINSAVRQALLGRPVR